MRGCVVESRSLSAARSAPPLRNFMAILENTSLCIATYLNNQKFPFLATRTWTLKTKRHAHAHKWRREVGLVLCYEEVKTRRRQWRSGFLNGESCWSRHSATMAPVCGRSASEVTLRDSLYSFGLAVISAHASRSRNLCTTSVGADTLLRMYP